MLRGLLLLCGVLLFSLASQVRAGGEDPCPPEDLALSPTGSAGRLHVVEGAAPGDAEAVLHALAKDGAGRDVVVYVHGFMTSLEAARCQGARLRAGLSGLPRYADGRPGPDIIIFAWPSAMPARKFSAAQQVARQYSDRLAGLLAEVTALSPKREVVILAHSLGAQVALGALQSARSARGTVVGLVLVQAAVPAVSIRTWVTEGELRFPALEVWCLVPAIGIPCAPPLTWEDPSVVGEYAAAAEVAQVLVVTTAAEDWTLRRWFALDELHFPDGGPRPFVVPVPGRIASDRDLRTLALGNPFALARLCTAFPPILIERIEPEPLFKRPWEDDVPDLALPDPTDIQEQTTFCHRFNLPHPGFHEIALEDLPPPDDWHSPLATATTRDALLALAWARVFRP